MSKATFLSIAAFPFFIPNAKCLLVEHVCRPELVIAVCECAILGIAFAIHPCLA
jgi:hypothetical protein